MAVSLDKFICFYVLSTFSDLFKDSNRKYIISYYIVVFKNLRVYANAMKYGNYEERIEYLLVISNQSCPVSFLRTVVRLYNSTTNFLTQFVQVGGHLKFQSCINSTGTLMTLLAVAVLLNVMV